jgi:hypothetical protein
VDVDAQVLGHGGLADQGDGVIVLEEASGHRGADDAVGDDVDVDVRRVWGTVSGFGGLWLPYHGVASATRPVAGDPSNGYSTVVTGRNSIK